VVIFGGFLGLPSLPRPGLAVAFPSPDPSGSSDCIPLQKPTTQYLVKPPRFTISRLCWLWQRSRSTWSPSCPCVRLRGKGSQVFDGGSINGALSSRVTSRSRGRNPARISGSDYCCNLLCFSRICGRYLLSRLGHLGAVGRIHHLDVVVYGYSSNRVLPT